MSTQTNKTKASTWLYLFNIGSCKWLFERKQKESFDFVDPNKEMAFTLNLEEKNSLGYKFYHKYDDS